MTEATNPGPIPGAQFLTLYTIYSNPSDYPDRYVMRPSYLLAGPHQASIQTGRAIVGSLEECRAAVPEGSHNLGRDPLDDPAILETWI